MSHERYMKKACHMAEKSCPSPNPPVGCIIVNQNKIIASSYHNSCGKAHAEQTAIFSAKKKGLSLKDATLYSTLEPCSTQGKTPACTDIIIKSGIKKVVYGSIDPTPENGNKAKYILEKNGIQVREGVLQKRTDDLIRFFAFFTKNNHPYTILKLASSLDGRIATDSKNSKWLSSETARVKVHFLRSQIDAILVGASTLKYDDPYLTARKNDTSLYEHQPTSIVISSQKIQPHYNIFKKGPNKVIIVRPESMKNFKEDFILKDLGVSFIYHKGNLLSSLYKELTSRHIMSLLIEGGAQTFKTFFKHLSFQEVCLFITPHIIGGSQHWQQGFSVDAIAKGCRPNRVDTERFEDDIMWNGFYSHPPFENRE